MSTAALRVLFVASECAPFAKTGGLGDVVGSLPKALRQRGIDVRVVMPLYAGIPWDQLEVLEGTLAVPMGYGGVARGAVRLGALPHSDVPVYFLEHRLYYDRPWLYGPSGSDYLDNPERFAFLSRGAIELCKALGFIPDVVHAHDWQTALVPVYLDTVEWMQPMYGAATVFTIHNLAHQGVAGEEAMAATGLGREHYNSAELEHLGALNLLKGALAHSTLLSTVSPTYAREIQMPAYGFGLDGELARRRDKLRGILNGIDADEWNPNTDPHIAAHYGANDLRGKAACKAALQEEAGLPVRAGVPLFGLVGRLSPQKGVDVLAAALRDVLSFDLQVVLLGTGDPDLERRLAWFGAQRPDRFRAFLHFDNPLAHRIEAGADFFLMPSRFEPCGLNQLYSLRYGTLPLVRSTGGLADTVEPYDERTGEGTGFVLHDLSPQSLRDLVGWAVSTWHDRPAHIEAMRPRAMTRDFSWQRAAAAYEALYIDAYARRRGHPWPPPAA